MFFLLCNSQWWALLTKFFYLRLGETGETLRLTGSTKNVFEGYLEWKADGDWYLICSDDSSWNIQAANVACRQIGYQNGAIHTSVGQNDHPNFREINLENLNSKDLTLRIRCTGEEPDLAHCQIRAGQKCRRNLHSVSLFCYAPSTAFCPKDFTPFQNHCYGAITESRFVNSRFFFLFSLQVKCWLLKNYDILFLNEFLTFPRKCPKFIQKYVIIYKPTFDLSWIPLISRFF